MRPKKCILLIDSDEVRRSVCSFVLATHAYRVVEFGEIPKQHSVYVGVDLIFLVGVFSDEVLAQLKEKRRWLPVMLVAEWDKSLPCPADCYLPPGVTSSELLDRIKIMVARKRGPRKGSRHQIHAVEAQAVAS